MKGVLGYTKEILRRAREGGSLVPFTEINTCRVRDKVVMSMAIQIMEKYLWKGRNGRDYIHFSTVCKLRTEVSDVYSTMSTAHEIICSLKSHQGSELHIYERSMQ